jgi:hypothetical protein
MCATLHMGGKPRGTEWSVVRAALAFALESACGDSRACAPRPADASLLMARAEIYFKLSATEAAAARLTPDNAGPSAVNEVFSALQSTALMGARVLAGGQYPTADLEERCAAVRDKLESVDSQRAKSTAERFTFPASLTDDCGPPTRRKPVLGALEEVHVERKDDSLDAARLRASTNLEWLPLLPEGAAFVEALQWVKQEYLDYFKVSQEASSPGECVPSEAAQLVLRGVEALMFRCAADGFAHPTGATPEDREREMSALEGLVEAYRVLLDDLLQGDDSNARMQVALRGRETLVVWIAFCMSHASAKATHAELTSFAVPLDWNALQHLVLDDKPALDASLRVSAYLKRHSSGFPVFSLRDDKGTFQLAEKHTRAHKSFLDTWRVEKQNVASRVHNHWMEV